MRTKKITTTHTLPTGILPLDLQRPKWNAVGGGKLVSDWSKQSFELWHTTGFGWCITTLPIGRDRTYAVVAAAEGRTKAGAVVRIGRGPHVTERVTVYVRVSRAKALQPFLDLKETGMGSAGQIRDRISSRRAQGQIERGLGNRSWRWDV